MSSARSAFTELVGWKHSMKNELIVARHKDLLRKRPNERLQEVWQSLGLDETGELFYRSIAIPGPVMVSLCALMTPIEYGAAGNRERGRHAPR